MVLGTPNEAPALLQSISTPSNSPLTASTIACMASLSVTSTVTGRAFIPYVFASSLLIDSISPARSAITTLQPFSASFSAMAYPIPVFLPDPVMMAVFPFRSSFINILHVTYSRDSCHHTCQAGDILNIAHTMNSIHLSGYTVKHFFCICCNMVQVSRESNSCLSPPSVKGGWGDSVTSACCTISPILTSASTKSPARCAAPFAKGGFPGGVILPLLTLHPVSA